MSTSIISNSIHLYDQEKVKTEYNASRLIKEWDNQYPVEFLDVPWSVIINKKLPLPEFPAETGLDRYVVCQHIRFRELIPYWKSMGVHHVFSPHCVFTDDEIVSPFPHHAPVCDELFKAISDRTIKASFVGAAYTHPSRKVLIEYFKGKKGYCVEDSGPWHFEKSEEAQKENKEHYHNVLSDSVFAFVPPGSGPGTIRMWEALGYGCISLGIENQDLALPGSFCKKHFNGLSGIEIKKLQDVEAATNILSVEEAQKRSYEAKFYYSEHQGNNLINSIKYRFRNQYGRKYSFSN